MSHVATVKTEVTDLAAVKALCKEMGWTFKENQKTYRWYGTSVGDYPLPAGMKKEDLGKCAHAIEVPGARYDIGLVKSAKGYILAYDFWGPGQRLKEVIGENGGKFLQGYGIAKATIMAKKKGYMVYRSTLPNGTVRLRVSGV
jgi:hypothetical protein